MNTGRYYFLLTAVVVLIFCPQIKAQDFNLWEPYDGVPVRQGDQIEFRESVATDDNGNSLVVWTSAQTGDIELYGQLLNSSGEMMWEESGKLLAQEISWIDYPTVIATGDNHWFIAWLDYRDSEKFSVIGDIYIQKYDMEGNPLWNDGINDNLAGVPVITGDYRKGYVNVINDNNNGTIIIWLDNRDDSTDIYAQRISPDGDFLWDNGGIPVARGPYNQGSQHSGSFSACSDGNGGLIAGWVDNRMQNDYENILAQRVDVDGNLLWSPPEVPEEARADTGLVIYDIEIELYDIGLCPDGSGGAFLVWKDLRNDEGDLYTQHVDEDGTVLWQENGEILCDEVAEQYHYQLVNSAPGTAVVAWLDHRNGDASTDLFMQRISGEDELILHWGEPGAETSGIVLCDVVFEQFDISMAAFDPSENGDGCVVVSWIDERSNGDYPYWDIYAEKIDEDGNLLWSENGGLLICDAYKLQSQNVTRIIHDGNETNALINWCDYRSGSSGIYCQFLDIMNGEPQLVDNGIKIIDGISERAKEPKIIFDGINLFIGWEDWRAGVDGEHPYIQKLDITDGSNIEPDFPVNGITLTPGTEEERFDEYVDSILFTFNNQGDIFAAWHDNRSGYVNAIVAQKMTSSGELLWGNTGTIVAEAYLRNVSEPKIIPDNDGGLFLVYEWVNEDWWVNIGIQHLDSNGQPLWGDIENIGQLITDENTDHRIEDFILFPSGNILLVYYTSISGNNFDLFAHCLDQEGNYVWDEAIPLSQADGYQNRAAAELVDEGMLVVWADHRRGENIIDIYGQIIDEDGNLLWDETDGRPLIEADNAQSYINLGVKDDESRRFWLTWQDTREPAFTQIYTQRFNLDGEPLLPLEEPNPAGIRVSASQYDQGKPKIVVNTNNDVYIVWEEEEADVIPYFGYFQVDLRYTHLDANGLPFEPYEAGSQVISDAYYRQADHKIVKDNTGGFICVWEDSRTFSAEPAYNIYAQRFDDNLVGLEQEKVVGIPENFELLPPHPNPFNPEIVIPFELPVATKVSLRIYNILGKEVAILTNETLNAGKHRITWDGKDLSGQSVSSGIYFIRMETFDHVKTQKVVMIK